MYDIENILSLWEGRQFFIISLQGKKIRLTLLKMHQKKKINAKTNIRASNNVETIFLVDP